MTTTMVVARSHPQVFQATSILAAKVASALAALPLPIVVDVEIPWAMLELPAPASDSEKMFLICSIILVDGFNIHLVASQ
jgi:hypothetical protein